MNEWELGTKPLSQFFYTDPRLEMEHVLQQQSVQKRVDKLVEIVQQGK